MLALRIYHCINYASGALRIQFLKSALNKPHYGEQRWYAHASARSWTEKTLVRHCPNDYISSWLIQRIARKIRAGLWNQAREALLMDAEAWSRRTHRDRAYGCGTAFYYPEVVWGKKEVREMKKSERESGESRCAVERVKIRNAAVAIANHSEAAARIAISCGFCRTLPNPWIYPRCEFRISHYPDNQQRRRSLPTRKRSLIPQLGVSFPLQIRTWIGNKPGKCSSRPVPFLCRG